MLYLFLSGLTSVALKKTPQAEISNGLVRAKLYLPDMKNGYYQGKRFDHSGNIASLVWNNHEYFGQWFNTYDPLIHDAIMGPVEEFTELDYNDAKAGETFVKIGVGILTKPDDQPYAFARSYPLVNPGKWTVRKHADNVVFIHELRDKEYAYSYEKSVILSPGKAELVLSHILKNTGKKAIDTSVYDHNFFIIDKQPVGPDVQVAFPFNLSATEQGFDNLAEIKGKKIVFLRPFGKDETVESWLTGFSGSSSDYDLKIENHKTHAGVRITCDQPVININFWSCATTACPEPYINIKAEPGKEFRWTIRYEFYTIP